MLIHLVFKIWVVLRKEVIVVVEVVVVFVDLPTANEEKCAEEVADCENHQNHTDYPEEVTQHDLAHDLVVVRQLLALVIIRRHHSL